MKHVLEIDQMGNLKVLVESLIGFVVGLASLLELPDQVVEEPSEVRHDLVVISLEDSLGKSIIELEVL